MSLKSILNNLIAERGYLSYDEMVNICRAEGKKPSNGERRLRKSDSPMVEKVMSDNGKYIKGYAWKKTEEIKKEMTKSLFPPERSKKLNAIGL